MRPETQPSTRIIGIIDSHRCAGERLGADASTEQREMALPAGPADAGTSFGAPCYAKTPRHERNEPCARPSTSSAREDTRLRLPHLVLLTINEVISKVRAD